VCIIHDTHNDNVEENHPINQEGYLMTGQSSCDKYCCGSNTFRFLLVIACGIYVKSF